jgi:hypothetical protein
MSDEIPKSLPGAPDEDREAGEPIGSLWQLEQDTSPSFLTKIRRRIYRRTTASQLISASWYLPGVVLAGLIEMLAHILGGAGPRKRD